VHLFGFVIRIYHDARSPERQKQNRHICIKTCSVFQLNIGLEFLPLHHHIQNGGGIALQLPANFNIFCE